MPGSRRCTQMYRADQGDGADQERREVQVLLRDDTVTHVQIEPLTEISETRRAQTSTKN